LKLIKSELVLKYKARAVLTNFLINKEGIIIEKDISIEDLKQLLQNK